MLPIVTSESETMKLCVPSEGKLISASESAHSLAPMVPFLDPEIAQSFLDGSTSTNSLIPRNESQVPIIREEEGGQNGEDQQSDDEGAMGIALQVFFPYLVAGFGMVGAGLLLDVVKEWNVFKTITEVMILVPPLLGLKGNLEMTLASRLSTQANLGHMDTTHDQLHLIGGNLILTQCQATVVGFLASFTAFIMGLLYEKTVMLEYALLLCTSSIITTSIASLFLGTVMAGVVMMSRKLNINPDNVATPIAASLGDLTTLAILAGIASLLFNHIDKIIWLGPLIITFFLLLIPLWVYLCRRNKFTQEALRTGWIPIISAMIISSIGGFILDMAVMTFKHIAPFQPVVNGVGGNLVAIQASRISTYLHKETEPGTLPMSHPKVCINPCSTFFGPGIHVKSVRVLMFLVIPGHLIFMYTISYVTGLVYNFTFVFVYLLVALVQVASLMMMSSLLVYWFWRHRWDPDNSTIPFLTAFGDLLGISLLTLAFVFLDAIHKNLEEETT